MTLDISPAPPTLPTRLRGRAAATAPSTSAPTLLLSDALADGRESPRLDRVDAAPPVPPDTVRDDSWCSPAGLPSAADTAARVVAAVNASTASPAGAPTADDDDDGVAAAAEEGVTARPLVGVTSLWRDMRCRMAVTKGDGRGSGRSSSSTVTTVSSGAKEKMR